jgi:GNAT superfamily N-acetyltransferase
MVSMIDIDSLRPGDRAAWEVLARGYKAFYRDPMPDEAYEQTWRRLLDETELHGLGARIDGRLAGIAHYFFHPTFWSAEACYLQDLFVDEAVRGRGAGRALIDGVARAARDRGATRLYWHTQEDNARARSLYDQVARFAGFIRYQYPLLPAAYLFGAHGVLLIRLAVLLVGNQRYRCCRSAMARTPAMNSSTPSW